MFKEGQIHGICSSLYFGVLGKNYLLKKLFIRSLF
jgi:hypothetical protein